MALDFLALQGILRIDAGPWRAGLGEANSQVQSASRQMAAGFRAVSTAVRQVVSDVQAVGVAVAAGMAAVTQQSIQVGASFEQTMSRTRALLSGATSDVNELNAAQAMLSKQARELGASTVFSATQAAEAMQFFALAGFDAQKIYDAMPATLDLAAAGQLQVGQAADIASKIMAGMGLTASDLEHAVDVMARAFTTANTDLTQLGEAMKYVGPIAAGAGLSIEETVAPLQIFSDAGIQASMAGTSLRNILADLSNPTGEAKALLDELGVAVLEADGSFRPLADIVDDLNAGMARTGREGSSFVVSMQLAGMRGGPALEVLLNKGGAALRAYEERLRGAGGTAERIAKTQLDNLRGSLELLSGATEEVQLGISDRLLPPLREVVIAMAEWTSANAAWLSGGFADAVLAAVAAFERFGEAARWAFDGLREPLAAAWDAVRGFAADATAWFEGLPAWAQNALVLAGGLVAIGSSLQTLGGLVPILGPIAAALGALINPASLLVTIGTALGGVLSILAGLFTPLGASIAAVVAAVGIGVVAFRELLSSNDAVREGWERLQSLAAALAVQVWDVLGAAFEKLIEVAVRVWERSEGLREKLALIALEVGERLMPALRAAATWLGENLPGAIDKAGHALEVLYMLVEGFADLWLTGDASRIQYAAAIMFGALIEGLAQLLQNWQRAANFLPDWLGGQVLNRNADAVIGRIRAVGAELRAMGESGKAVLDRERAMAREAKESAERRKQIAERQRDQEARWRAEEQASWERAEARRRAAAPGAAVAAPAAAPAGPRRLRLGEAVAAMDAERAAAAGPAAPAAPVPAVAAAAGPATVPGGAGSDRVAAGPAAGPAEPAWLAGLRGGSDAQIAGTQRQVGALFRQQLSGLRGRASQEDVAAVRKLQGEVQQQMLAIRRSHGDTRKAAVEELNRLVDAYREAYAKATGVVTDAARMQAEEARRGARESADAQAAGARQGAERAQAEQQSVQGRSGSPIGNMMGGIAQMGSALAGMFQSATAGIGRSFAAFGQLVQSTTDPIARLDLQIQNVQAQLQGVRINQSQFGRAGGIGGLTAQFEASLAALQRERAQEVQRRQSARDELFARDRASRLAQDRESMDSTLSIGLRSAVDFGPGFRQATERERRAESDFARAQALTVNLTVNGPVSPRDLLESIDREAKRLGLDRSGRSFLRAAERS